MTSNEAFVGDPVLEKTHASSQTRNALGQGWPRRILRGLATAWSIVGVTLVLLVVINYALGAWLDSRPRLPTNWYRDAFEPSEPGLKEFTREFDETAYQPLRNYWQPYVYSRNAPFSGKYINIDRRGLRRTVNRVFEPDGDLQPVSRIYVLGGSTAWGHGARDEFTVASILSRLLADKGHHVEVVNLGQLGYVNTQEVFTLFTELQRGATPRVAIFLDGFNDTLSTMVNGVPGLTINEDSRRREFKVSRQPASDLAGLALRATPLFRTFAGTPRLSFNGASQTVADAVPTDLGQATIDLYLANLHMVGAIGQAHGFTTLAYWQPIAFEKTQLTAAETEGLQSEAHLREPFLNLFHRLHDDIDRRRAAPGLQVAYLGDLFNDPTWPKGVTAFYDACHLTEAGNEALARRMLPDVERALTPTP